MVKKGVKAGTSKAEAAKRRALFIEAMTENGGNKYQAAIAAGFPKGEAAKKAATRLSDDVRVLSELERRRAEVIERAKEKTQLTANEVIESLARDIRFDPAKLYNEDGSLRRITDMDEDTRLALRSVEVDEIKAAGNVIGHTTKVKFPEKTSAREQGMKHFGLYGEDNRQKPPTFIVVAGLDEEL